MTGRELALFTPLPPTRSGISDYSMEIARALKKHWDITFVIADDAEEPVGVPAEMVARVSEWKAGDNGQVPRFYQLGNNHYHAYIYRELIEHPGVTLMHDYSMHHLLVEMTLTKGDDVSYLELMSEGYGAAGIALANLRCYEQVHHGITEFIMPLNHQVLEKSLGIVVHSHSSLNDIHDRFPETAAVRVPFPYEDPAPELLLGGRDVACDYLGLDKNKLYISSFGFVTPPKQIEFTLRALARCQNEIPDFEFIIVGEVSPAVPIEDLLKELGMQDRVKVTGFVDFNIFHHYIEASDIIVSLRYPSAGETSAALMRAMGMGRANIVFNYASYGDYPGNTVYKIPLDTERNSFLIAAIKRLAKDSAYREQLARNARRHLLESHRIEDVAEAVTGFITNCYK
jgi:glycosyltransferase involved in cell wall biosynthesis